MTATPTVPAAALNETVELVILFEPDGSTVEIKAEQLRTIDLANLGIAWTDADGKIHRCVGLPMKVISRENRIVKPA